MATKTLSFASARLRYHELLRALADDGQNLPAAVEIGELCPVLGIDAVWAQDDLKRLRRAESPKSIKQPT